MPRYIGFNSTRAYKRPTIIPIDNPNGSGDLNSPISTQSSFTQIDDQLVIQDLLNSMNISQGELPGIPSYGTSLWTFVFDPNTSDVVEQITSEVKRLVSLDPRIQMGYVSAKPSENSVLIQLEIAIAPTNNTYLVNVSMDRFSGIANLV